MSDEAITRPLAQFGDEGAEYCDPESGVCVFPAASEIQDSGNPPLTAGGR